MDLQNTLYPVQWCILFIILGFLVKLIELASGSYSQVLFIAYYGSIIAALIALLLFTINITRVLTEIQPKQDSNTSQ
jgi:hypothetical protein